MEINPCDTRVTHSIESRDRDAADADWSFWDAPRGTAEEVKIMMDRYRSAYPEFEFRIMRRVTIRVRREVR